MLDHRLNSRTVYMNPISRFIYWNMNYHIEHHMFPMVPYHAAAGAARADQARPAAAERLDRRRLPRDVAGLAPPAPLRGLFPQARAAADREALPRGLPRPGPRRRRLTSTTNQAARKRHAAWIRACSTDDIDEEDVARFDHGGRTFAIYHAPDGEFFATDGLCTHEQVHLADGLVMDYIIECPKHNGRFDYRTGAAKGAPVCVNLNTYQVKVEGDDVLIEIV